MRRRDFFKYGIATGVAALLGIKTDAVKAAEMQELRKRTWDSSFEEMRKGWLCKINGRKVYPWSWVIPFVRGNTKNPVVGAAGIVNEADMDYINVVRCNVVERWIEFTVVGDLVALACGDTLEGGFWDQIVRHLELCVKRNEKGSPVLYRLENVEDLILDVIDERGNIVVTLRSEV